MSADIWTGDGWEVRHGKWQDSAPDEVDCIITDPPFSDHVSHNQRRCIDQRFRSGVQCYDDTPLSFDGVDPYDLAPAFVARARRWALIWCAVEQVGDYRRAVGGDRPKGGAYIRPIPWVKTNPTPQFSGDRSAMWGEVYVALHRPGGKMHWNGGGKALVHRGSYEMRDRHHETQKPLWLMVEMLEHWTDPGELVWDPYGGSMTTGVACLLTGRRFLGHEMQHHYAKGGADRLRATTQGLTLEDYRAGQQSLFSKEAS